MNFERDKKKNDSNQEIHNISFEEEYKNELLNAREVKDFLPPPEQLVPKVETKKVTISLSTKSIEFFKSVSAKTDVPYQQLIRKVLDTYADHHAKTGSGD